MIRARIVSAFLVPALLCLAACDKKEPAAQTKPTNTQTAAAPVEAAADWCGEHEIPESICTKCNKKLIADFKKIDDPNRAAELGFASPFWSVDWDFTLAPLRDDGTRRLVAA